MYIPNFIDTDSGIQNSTERGDTQVHRKHRDPISLFFLELKKMDNKIYEGDTHMDRQQCDVISFLFLK
jgi:hypothetical protein